MKIIIKTKNFDLSPDTKNYLEDKMNSLDKYLVDISSVKNFDIKAIVEIGKFSKHHLTGPFFEAKGYLYLPKRTLRAKAKKENLKFAIDEIKNDFKNEIEKYKGSIKSLTKRRARGIKKLLHFSNLARFWRKGRIRDEGR